MEKEMDQVLGSSETEEALATHSSILAWRIPGTEEPGSCRLQSHTKSDMTETTQQQQQQQLRKVRDPNPEATQPATMHRIGTSVRKTSLPLSVTAILRTEDQNSTTITSPRSPSSALAEDWSPSMQLSPSVTHFQIHLVWTTSQAQITRLPPGHKGI